MNKPIKGPKQTLFPASTRRESAPSWSSLTCPQARLGQLHSLRTVKHEAEHSTSHHSKQVSKSQRLYRDATGMCFLWSSSPWTMPKWKILKLLQKVTNITKVTKVTLPFKELRSKVNSALCWVKARQAFQTASCQGSKSGENNSETAHCMRIKPEKAEHWPGQGTTS